MSLSAICISSSVISVLMSLALFWTRLFVFSLVRFEGSSCILDTSPLSVMWFANIFSQSIVCLFNLHRIFHKAKDFNFDEVQLPIFHFMDCVFGVKSKDSLLSPMSQRFLPIFFKFYILPYLFYI